MTQDLRYGWRSLRRHPGVSAAIVLTLALAIGANTALFSLMDALWLRALPARDPQALVLLKWSAHRRPFASVWSYGDCHNAFSDAHAEGCSFSLPFFRQLQAGIPGLEAVTGYGGRTQLNVSHHGVAMAAMGQMVAGNYFQTLGVGAALGRVLSPADDATAAPAVAVLSYAYWQSAFGGSPGVVGQAIEINGIPATIVGVAGRRFSGLTPGYTYDLWVPLSLRPRLTYRWTPGMNAADSAWVVMVARLQAPSALGRAQAEVSGRFRNAMLAGSKPMLKDGDAPAVALLPAQTALMGVRGQFTHPLALLMWAAGAVLLIACANIAGLLLVRASGRRRELAVRRALGASPARLLRQLLTESLLLAALGGVLGLGLAYLGAHALLRLIVSGSMLPLGLRVTMDPRVWLFTAAIALGAGIVFGAAPALRGARMDLNQVLKVADGAGATSGEGRRRHPLLGNGLAVAQIALCLVVLAGAGLLVRTLENLRDVDPGFDTSHLLLFSVAPALAGYQGAAVLRLDDQLQRTLGGLPGVLGVSHSSSALLSDSLSMTSFHLGGPAGPEVSTDILRIGPSFFDVMHMKMLNGRALTSTDFAPQPDPAAAPPTLEPPTPAVVNATFARKYLKGNPLGQHFGDPKHTNWVAVGVVSDARYNSLSAAVAPTIYPPDNGGYTTFEVRTASRPMAMLPAVRRVVGQIAPRLTIVRPMSQAQSVDRLLFQQRLLAQISSVFAGMALLLACIGLYGLLAQDVTRRTREIGIRMVLGAPAPEVLRMVLARGAVVAITGLAIGLGGAWVFTRYLKSVLFGVGTSDAATLAAVAGLLFALALLASYLPARRASRLRPVDALRHE